MGKRPKGFSWFVNQALRPILNPDSFDGPRSHLDQETQVNILTLGLLAPNLSVLVVANVDSLIPKRENYLSGRMYQLSWDMWYFIV